MLIYNKQRVSRTGNPLLVIQGTDSSLQQPNHHLGSVARGTRLPKNIYYAVVTGKHSHTFGRCCRQQFSKLGNNIFNLHIGCNKFAYHLIIGYKIYKRDIFYSTILLN